MNITTNTTTEFDVKWQGGTGRFNSGGTADSATITLKFYDEDNAEWVTLGPDTTFVNASGVGHFDAPRGTRLAVTTAGGGGSLDINVGLNKVT